MKEKFITKHETNDRKLIALFVQKEDIEDGILSIYFNDKTLSFYWHHRSDKEYFFLKEDTYKQFKKIISDFIQKLK